MGGGRGWGGGRGRLCFPPVRFEAAFCVCLSFPLMLGLGVDLIVSVPQFSCVLCLPPFWRKKCGVMVFGFFVAAHCGGFILCTHLPQEGFNPIHLKL